MSDTTIARAESPRGEVVLRRRGRDGELELRVNGIFVMDSVQTATERALATLGLDRIATSRDLASAAELRVLVGGLGLGFTLAEFAASPLVAHITVVEIEPVLVEWHREGLIPYAAGALLSGRVEVLVGDVRDAIVGLPASSVDVIVLDVDNGPGFLVYDDNAAIYQAAFLDACREALVRRGVVVVWSADHAPKLGEDLNRVFGSHAHHRMGVTLGERRETYHVYLAPGHYREEPQWPAH